MYKYRAGSTAKEYTRVPTTNAETAGSERPTKARGVVGSVKQRNPFCLTLTELIEVWVSVGDVGIKLVVVANREDRSIHLSQLVHVSLCDIPKSDVPSA